MCECKRHLHIMNQTCLWTFRAYFESSCLAVAAALAAFREDEWVGQIGNGLTTVNVTVQQPAAEHQVRVQDFWHG